ncbi:dihydrofolate reductase [Limosilactobacillus antri]|uniref:dihydrofolate reductase n=1 Tax=Limosilactobacillus antri TaxID=227943 RepID=UPI001F55AFF9|nr:dihydrofolate reductase [Limosilactobacillus antri]
MTEVNFVWAEDLDGWIGKDHDLPWHVSADLRHFKRETVGRPVVMGRRTYESIGRPLPHRENVVLTHHPVEDGRVQSLATTADFKQWLARTPEQEVAVIGGAQVFAQLLDQATILTRTVINGHYAGDTKMPPIDYDRWQLVDRQPVEEAGQVVCWFEKWVLNVKQD